MAYDAKTRAISVLLKYKPMIEGFKNAIAEERKKGASEARIAAMLHYVETTSSDIDPDAMEWMRIELAEAAKAQQIVGQEQFSENKDASALSHRDPEVITVPHAVTCWQRHKGNFVRIAAEAHQVGRRSTGHSPEEPRTSP